MIARGVHWKTLRKGPGNLKTIPDLAITTIAETPRLCAFSPEPLPRLSRRPSALRRIGTRWNDYGIGLFLQGDLKAAAAALRENHRGGPKKIPTVGQHRPRFGAGGRYCRGRKVLEKSLAIDSRLAPYKFFYARVLKERRRL